MIESGKLPNIYLEISGFHYLTDTAWNFTYPDTRWVCEQCFGASGTNLCRGSDFPVVKQSMTYTHWLEAFRTYCGFVSADDRGAIPGGILEGLIDRCRTVDNS